MKRSRCAMAGILAGGVCTALALACDSAATSDFPPRAQLRLPVEDLQNAPPLLSQTGAFQDLRSLRPAAGLVPYKLNLPFWSDGAEKQRWVALPPGAPPGKIRFASTGEWVFPAGTVFIKHFELDEVGSASIAKHRLETRFLAVNSTGGVRGVTYKWRSDNSDADLLATNLLETIELRTSSGIRTQNWYYPSREDCQTCHTALSGGVLGPNTRQLNRELEDPDGAKENQLNRWARLGLLEGLPSDLRSLPQLAEQRDDRRSLEDRARSWLDANCAYCHRPGGTVASFDARFEIPPASQGIVNGTVLIDEGIDHARIIAPNDEWRSILLLRVNTLEGYKMPPLARETIDTGAVDLLRQWVRNLPGPQVLPPPVIFPKPGEFGPRVRVTLSHPDPKAMLYYTLDGSVPGKSAAVYRQPLELTTPVTVRAKAFREGWNRSVTVQATFTRQ